MEVQLNDLYRSLEEEGDAAEMLAAIEDVLGISTREEAEELSEIARQMEDQLTTLYEDKQKLQDLGLESIGDAVDMIENMEDQLTDLYEDREALRSLQTIGDTEDQSTFEQLEALYAERERLQQALGVSSADDVIELVESLNTQLDELYKGRDAEVDPEERHDVLLWEPDEPDEPTSPDETPPEEADTALTMNSMEHQLEALYREKETLLHHGFTNAREAVSQIHTQQKQIDVLQRENHAYEQRFERLQTELGTAKVPELVELVRALEADPDASLDDVVDTTTEPSGGPEYGIDIEAASPFVDEETLDRLNEMEPAELDDLDAGVVRLSDDGTVEYLNEAALQLPGLSSTEDRSVAVGKNFFLDLAPSTNNNLFYGRFQKGQRRGEMDARFPYTFTSPDEGPEPFAVHLHRKPGGEATWLLYRPS
jgi:photoactive yellow protein